MDSIKEKVYCQTCKEEILDGAYVSDVKSVYHPKRKCVPKKSREDNTVEYRTRQEIQQDIQNGKLVHYGKLEESILG